jgi:predicted DNA-binding transcriptional regulator AlpA
MNKNKDLNNILERTEQLGEKEYYSMNEVLNILQITDTTLYRYINLGYFNKVKMFGRTWFRGTELHNYILKELQPQPLSE